ncbi:MAG: lipopolysaccharide biosynthesis protein, partial [Gammaproteobacteria bacterium]|nr:lipopolysaccharide biosynthesis protein [Gammaproteobacteria bacterium]
PQIVQSKKIVEGLEQSLAAMVSDSAEESADNPAYLVLKTRLQATEADIRATRQQIIEAREKLEKYEGYLSQAPQVEKEFQRLGRDYQNTYAKYQEIRAKQMAAELAQNLESEQKGERFTLIQPPEIPVDPVSPNRVALILLGLILAGGAGVGVALLLEALDDGIYSVSEVVNLTGAVPLVTVGYMETREEAKKHNRKRVYYVLAALVAVAIFLALFHFLIKPLDVTWYILLRKLGIG